MKRCRAVADARPDFSPTGVTLSHDPRAPLVVTAGRNRSLFVNPYTGNVAEPAGQRARAFFEAVEGWHRWFNVAGDRRALARAVTGACNLAFLFLVLSGVYLWLPRTWAWTALSTRLLFNRLAVLGEGARLQLASRLRHLVGGAARHHRRERPW